MTSKKESYEQRRRASKATGINVPGSKGTKSESTKQARMRAIRQAKDKKMRRKDRIPAQTGIAWEGDDGRRAGVIGIRALPAAVA